MNSNSDRTIAIPIDEQGVIDYDNDVSKEDHLKYYILPAIEFNFLWNCGFFDKLNAELELVIKTVQKWTVYFVSYFTLKTLNSNKYKFTFDNKKTSIFR